MLYEDIEEKYLNPLGVVLCANQCKLCLLRSRPACRQPHHPALDTDGHIIPAPFFALALTHWVCASLVWEIATYCWEEQLEVSWSAQFDFTQIRPVVSYQVSNRSLYKKLEVPEPRSDSQTVLHLKASTRDVFYCHSISVARTASSVPQLVHWHASSSNLSIPQSTLHLPHREVLPYRGLQY